MPRTAHPRFPGVRRRLRLSLAVVLLLSWHGASLDAQAAGNRDARGDTTRVHAASPYPDLRKTRELEISGLGVGFAVTGALQAHGRLIPPSGFDPRDIAWGVDRRTVDNYNPAAATASDWTADASILFPLVLGLATVRPAGGWRGFGRRSVLYGETFLVSQGLTFLGKTTFGRPRPYAYRSEDQRPGHPSDEPASAGTFQSMPSGHSSSAWTGVAIGLTEHLLHRPQADWMERVSVGVLGGALAGATSALRVTAGQHFPSDVLVGAGIGIATGVALPLWHRGDRPMPSRSAWLQMTGGVVAGATLGAVVARRY